jgi:gliding motility-associated-like protein
MKIWLGILCIFVSNYSFSQSQACPLNINYSNGTLTHWFAYTSNNIDGRGDNGIAHNYDSTAAAPAGTIGAKTITEYNLNTPGIQVLTSPSFDFFGGFLTIPTINGYQYDYSILLGSTSISRNNGSGSTGGYLRGVSYKFKVPTSATSQPYTMTYAYAMVLENGAHNSSQQPLIYAQVETDSGIITCASPKYYLPATGANPQGGGAMLDSVAAIDSGFRLSPQLSPNPDPNSSAQNAQHLQDVWYKPWTEVTFDLSPYRGQEVTITFEADNCIPGGHFAYGYIAIRNTCAGLLISGDSPACIGSTTKYSIPSLANANYQWSVPSDWVIDSGSNTNIITVKVGTQPGNIIAKEQNGCALLTDTLDVTTNPPTVPGNAAADAIVCAGINTTPLTLSANNGNVLKWVSSTDGINWTDLGDPSTSYTAQNLNVTTIFKAVVQNGSSCAIDSSTSATVTVDPKSVGGQLDPSNSAYCAGQNINSLIVLNGKVGNVVDWQLSSDSVNWSYLSPLKLDTSYNVTSISSTTYYRVIVKDGVCPQDTSSVATLTYYSAPFPQATIDPVDTTICYGATAILNALVTVGTNYSWVNYDSLNNEGDGIISSVPSLVTAGAVPPQTSFYVLNIQNAGCPNTLSDTFHITVIPPIIVSVVRDTAVVINEPVQFNATSNDGASDIFLWSPSSFLNNANIANPIGIYGGEIDSISYIVTATDSFGCYGQAPVTVKIFKTLPDIFVPNAFTPGQTSNNIFRPIPVGIADFQFFKVYNRWGQLVYSTSQTGVGWNGIYRGKPQDTGTFVWMAQGVSYLGQTIFRKGTVVLIR